MSGGKGGSQTSQVTIPAYIESASRKNLNRADEIAQLGYTPYFGPDVAAFSPMQQAAFANTGQAAQAFGLSGGGMTGMEGMPQAQPMAGGGYGYSSAPIYEAALGKLQQRAPAQYDFMAGMFIDPVTGMRPSNPFGSGRSIYGDGNVARRGGAFSGKGGEIAATGQVPLYQSPERQAIMQSAENTAIREEG